MRFFFFAVLSCFIKIIFNSVWRASSTDCQFSVYFVFVVYGWLDGWMVAEANWVERACVCTIVLLGTQISIHRDIGVMCAIDFGLLVGL